MLGYQRLKVVRWIVRSITGVAVTLALCLPQAAKAQERSTITCSSMDGQRVFCQADTRGGVRLERQLGDSQCEEGSTWGYTDQGVWVDRGCQAEFFLSAERPREMYADRDRFTRIEPGTLITIRTNEFIDSDRA